MAERNINQNINQAIYGLNLDSIPEQVKPGQLSYALNAVVENFDGNMISYQNEQSNVLCTNFPTGYKVIGVHSTNEQNKTILFLVNPYTYDSEIGYIQNTINCDYDNPSNLDEQTSSTYVNNGYNPIDCNCAPKSKDEVLSFYERYINNLSKTDNKSCCEYNKIINSKCLNFSIDNPIFSIVHRTTRNCEVEIYWADGLNPRRFINLNDLPFKEILNGCDRIKTQEVDCSLLDVQGSFSIPCITPILVIS